MNIIVNSIEIEVEQGISIQQLIVEKNIVSKYIAVEINKYIVPKSDYQKYKLKDGDQIEIITAIGGG